MRLDLHLQHGQLCLRRLAQRLITRACGQQQGVLLFELVFAGHRKTNQQCKPQNEPTKHEPGQRVSRGV
jgi:hypothetical protein